MAETRWFEQGPKDLQGIANDRRSGGKDLWLRCPGCTEVLYKPALTERAEVCLHCGHHFKIGAMERVRMLVDEGSFVRFDAHLKPVDALGFIDSKPYTARIEASQKKTGENDAAFAGSATIDGIPIELCAFNFAFMGGSMGSVVGEAVTRCFERATARKVAAMVISSSGGARMQEGILSLMQMAKSCAALARLRDEANKPYISLLTHPTTGGVAASFAMLGDVILAEPNALIGFAGPRVIEQTIGESLPEGFQTSEYLLAHGMVDRIVHRGELRAALTECLDWFGCERIAPVPDEEPV